MFDLKKNIIPTRVFIEKLGITPHSFYKKNLEGSFTDQERSIIFNIIKNYPPIYPNVPLLDNYLRINNISLTEFRTRLQVQRNFFYCFKAIPLAEEPQRDIISMLQSGEPLNLNKLIDPLANERVKMVLKKNGINLLQFRNSFLNDHEDVNRYLRSYSSLFLNLEYTQSYQRYMIDYIVKNMIN